MKYIKYTKARFKYQLVENFSIQTDILGYEISVPKFIKLDRLGTLYIYTGYAWDGASGIAIDTKNFMRGSLVHDALYQLMRWGLLPHKYKIVADKLLIKVCHEDGMSKIRCTWVYLGVKYGGGPSTKKTHKRKVYQAPRRKE